MSSVFGRSLLDARARSGSVHQFAGLERSTLDEGPERGARRLRVWTGGGLEVDFLPDRSFDIGAVRFRGTPVAWIGPRGMVAPALDQDRSYLGAFSGGLLATCGLDSFGSPSTDAGVDLPQHGRIGRQPSEVVRAQVLNDRIVLEVSGPNTAEASEIY